MLCFFLVMFPRLVRRVGNLLFFFYSFLDGVRFINEVQEPFRPFWIYISIFTQTIVFWFIIVFLFFSIFIAIYIILRTRYFTNEVNNGSHYQCQSNVWACVGIIRRRSVFENIYLLSKIWFNTYSTYINHNS